jgi:hypothetical protein
MNYKMLFIVVAFNYALLNARHYESMFSQWGQELPAFTLEKNDTNVLVTVDTGKKVTVDDIVITHKDSRVSVDVKGLDHTLTLKLESSRHTFGISMCSQKHEEKKSEQEYSAYQGSSCMQQAMSVAVDLPGITAEYSGTKLILSVPLVKEEQGKKIHVVMKDSAPAATEKVTQDKKKKHKPFDSAQGERIHEK